MMTVSVQLVVLSFLRKAAQHSRGVVEWWQGRCVNRDSTKGINKEQDVRYVWEFVKHGIRNSRITE